MTGYGLAFPLNSKHKAKFNEKLLEYRFNHDDDNDWCKILLFMNFKEATVWYEQRKNLVLRENGDLERLGRFWLHGVCKPNMQVREYFFSFLALGMRW